MPHTKGKRVSFSGKLELIKCTFAKNPPNGGMPAKESRATDSENDKSLLDLLKSTKSAKSLFTLIACVLAPRNKKMIAQL